MYCYRLQSPAGAQQHNVLVVDLGGGTFDTVLLQRSIDLIEVSAPSLLGRGVGHGAAQTQSSITSGGPS